MKLKILPQFLQSPFYKNFFLSLFFLGLGSVPARTFGEETPGIIESLERLIEVHKKQFDQNKSQIQSNLKTLTDISGLKEVKLDPQFVRSLIAHSDDKYLRLAQHDECKFLSVLENNLLRSADGETSSIFIVYKSSDGNTEKAIVSRENFFENIYKKTCLNNREYATLFNAENFQKTIEGIRFSVPKGQEDCLAIHKEWQDNPFSSYLCRINQTIKKSRSSKIAEMYSSKIQAMPRSYIENFCNNITDPALFCESYLKQDVWTKVINGEAPTYKMSYKCQNMMGLSTAPTLKDLKNCGAKLISTPSLCETAGNKDLPALFPLQNCDKISDALKKSKLKVNYHDCPGNVDNEAITNAHRIVNHFSKNVIPANKDNCAGEASYTFAKLNFDIKHDEGWPLKICYMNHVTEKEVCVPYIPGSRAEEPLSEDQVMAKILYQQRGAPAKTKCRIVDSKLYSPLRSEFKFGCFIVYDAESCTTLNCQKKVIWEDKTLSDIKFTGRPVFDYFPTAFANERYSFVNMMNEAKGTEERSIKNLTDLKFYLDNIPNSIVHGVGCVEDLMPEEFQRISINQCHPMPFIIDGHLNKNNETWLIFRSAIDDVHTPRLILWQNVFNAVSAHRELHPLNTWTLYGIKK